MTPQTRQPQSIGQLLPAGSPTAAAPVFDPEVGPQTPAPSDGRDGTFIKNFGKFEREGATYSWFIFVPGKQKFYGYSKPKGMAEKANKQELLMDIIRRLNKGGYVRERNKIVFFRNFDDDDENSVKLLTLYGTRYDPEAVVVGQTWLVQFLNNFYNPPIHQYGTELFPTGESNTPPPGRVIIPDQRKQAPPLDAFSEQRQFRDASAVMAYADKLLRDGQAHGRVLDYSRKMVERLNKTS